MAPKEQSQEAEGHEGAWGTYCTRGAPKNCWYFGVEIVVFCASYFNVAASKGAESILWGQKIQCQGQPK